MLEYERHSNAFSLRNGGYWVQFWKTNHVVFGKAHTAGCWVKRFSGRNAIAFREHLNTAATWGTKHSGLTVAEFKELYEESERLKFTLHVTTSQLYFVWRLAKIVVTADAESRRRVAKAIAEMAADMGLPATVKVAKVSAKETKRAAAIARTQALLTPEAAAAAAAVVKTPAAPAPVAPVAKKAAIPEVNRGLPAAQLSAYRRWHGANHKALHGVPMADAIALYNDNPGPVEVTEAAPAEEKPAVLVLHDAHVLAYRRARANRLKALRRQVVREGQGLFRVHVLANYDGCAITGGTEHIEAAHIIAHANGGEMHPANGVPLVAWLHAAFDTLAFTINPVTLVVSVAPTARQWLHIDGIQIADGKLWPLDRAALTHHYERFKDACRA